MAELQHEVEQPDVYDRLIDRLGLALDTAKTAVRLRNESPAELELRGLSHAEFQLIEAYLTEVALKEDFPIVMRASSSTSREPSEPMQAPHPHANVIWLKDQRRAKVSAKLSRYSSTKHFKR